MASLGLPMEVVRGTQRELSLSLFECRSFAMWIDCRGQIPSKLSPGSLMAETRHVQTFVLRMFLVEDTKHLEFCFFLEFRGWGSSAQPQVWG